jgi:hypothetical protein
VTQEHLDPRAASDLAHDLAAVLDPVYARLGRIARAVLASRPAGGSGWSESHLLAVRKLVQALIVEDDLFVGMGFVAAPALVDGQDRYMMWLQRNEGRTSRLRLNFDASSIDVYDYLEMDWFRLAAQGREHVAMGPYVDYAGSELYVITATIPVVAGEQFLGIAGADLLFAEVERRLVGVLRTTATDAVVVSSERRVVAANSARWVLGSRLPALPEAGEAAGDVTGEEAGPVYGEVVELPLGTGWRLGLVADQTGGDFSPNA